MSGVGSTEPHGRAEGRRLAGPGAGIRGVGSTEPQEERRRRLAGAGSGQTLRPDRPVVYVDGEYVDGPAASVPIWDHGLLYGDGVFEGMRVFDGSLFRPRDHIARLGRSARALGLELPLDADALLDVIREVVRRSGLQDAHVRPILTRGVGHARNRPGPLPERRR